MGDVSSVHTVCTLFCETYIRYSCIILLSVKCGLYKIIWSIVQYIVMVGHYTGKLLVFLFVHKVVFSLTPSNFVDDEQLPSTAIDRSGWRQFCTLLKSSNAWFFETAAPRICTLSSSTFERLRQRWDVISMNATNLSQRCATTRITVLSDECWGRRRLTVPGTFGRLLFDIWATCSVDGRRYQISVSKSRDFCSHNGSRLGAHHCSITHQPITPARQVVVKEPMKAGDAVTDSPAAAVTLIGRTNAMLNAGWTAAYLLLLAAMQAS